MLRVEPSVSAATADPFLKCWLDGTDYAWQWSPVDIEHHAESVMQCFPVCQLDALYRGLLVDKMGLEPERAEVVIDDLINFRR